MAGFEVTTEVLNMAYLAANHGEKVKLWFEESRDTSVESHKIYNALRALESWEYRDRLDGVSFNPKTLLPLQSADLVAREALKHAQNLGLRPTRKPTERLWQQIGFLMWSGQDLENLRHRGYPDKLEALSAWRLSDNPPRPQYFYVKNLRQI